MGRTCLFHFLVFVQAGIQWIALVVNTVTKMSAALWAAIVLAPVRAFKLRIAGPDVVQKLIDNNYGQGRRETKTKNNTGARGIAHSQGRLGTPRSRSVSGATHCAFSLPHD